MLAVRTLGIASILALSLAGCALDADPGSLDEDATGTNYGDITARVSAADLARWQTDKAALDRSFGNVCGDTFCSGDYSNLNTAALSCSTTQAGYVKECTWVLGGSLEYVDGKTGAFNVDARTFTCSIPVKTKVAAFLGALENGTGEVIHRALPGTGRSFYDSLGDCFSGVVGQAPPASTGTQYAEMVDYLSATGDPGPWYDLRDALSGDFAGACSGSFCQGAWPGIAPLRFVCAVDSTKAQVKACHWSFVGASLKVNSKGAVTSTTKAFQCDVKIKGTPAAVSAVLSGADPLHAKLPGSTKNLATQLAACIQ